MIKDRRIISSEVKYVVGRWNSKSNTCEYVSGWNFWKPDVTNAKTFYKNDPEIVLHIKRTDKFTQIFISKVFSIHYRPGWAQEKRTLTLTSPNIWHELDAVINHI